MNSGASASLRPRDDRLVRETIAALWCPSLPLGRCKRAPRCCRLLAEDSASIGASAGRKPLRCDGVRRNLGKDEPPQSRTDVDSCPFAERPTVCRTGTALLLLVLMWSPKCRVRHVQIGAFRTRRGRVMSSVSSTSTTWQSPAQRADQPLLLGASWTCQPLESPATTRHHLRCST
jgi:hypothetical protein